MNALLDLAKLKVGDTITGQPFMANLCDEPVLYTCAENDGVSAGFNVTYHGIFLGVVEYSNASANENGWRWV